jgi:alkanesulfonate monooxygenase SsuD/methylene tetrahydromethanopterin reductase-like flavin-dependent oxidoreductase (luciferase family)
MGQDEWSGAERADRFGEYIELLDLLLTQAVTSYAGRYYNAREAPMTPGCVQRPRVPFSIAAAGRRSLELVARYAQRWVTLGPTDSGPRDPARVYDVVRAQCERLLVACAEVGRDPSSVGRVLLTTTTGPDIPSLAAFEDLAGRYAELGFDEIVLHHPRQTGPYHGDLAVLEEIMGRYGKTL